MSAQSKLQKCNEQQANIYYIVLKKSRKFYVRENIELAIKLHRILRSNLKKYAFKIAI